MSLNVWTASFAVAPITPKVSAAQPRTSLLLEVLFTVSINVWTAPFAVAPITPKALAAEQRTILSFYGTNSGPTTKFRDTKWPRMWDRCRCYRHCETKSRSSGVAGFKSNG